MKVCDSIVVIIEVFSSIAAPIFVIIGAPYKRSPT
jgi:hypothetical protein